VSAQHETVGRFGRRDAIKIGGLTVSLAALVAACGEDLGGSEDGGRVGYQPPITDPPEYAVDDIVLLRTIASVETTVADVYASLIETGTVEGEVLTLLERFTENHRAIADEMNGFAVDAGGEAWECGNPWMVGRLVEPLLESIASSDNPGRDVFNSAVAMENLTVATNQAYSIRITITEAAEASLAAAALEARQSAALVSQVVGFDGYVSPVLGGGDAPLDADGVVLQFAVQSRFGSTGQIDLVAGPPDENGVRVTYSIQTPADNAYVYAELEPSC
jgi:hypothetical protein